ncbi:MAG TPA: PAS domain-containing protein, partial [Cytophagales bacterium]|nr:PAS domain-containing protein [Cytophagales bacterium]
KRTEKLLNESTMQGEEMKAQEEEMRQNLEELSATQEEMHRVLKEFQEKERYMKELMNASNDGILTVDRDMHVINCNEAFKKTYSAHGLNIEKGFDLNNFFTTDEEKKKYAAIYERVFKGESFEIIETYETGDVPTKISIHYSPLRNEEGKIIAAAVFIHNMNG